MNKIRELEAWLNEQGLPLSYKNTIVYGLYQKNINEILKEEFDGTKIDSFIENFRNDIPIAYQCGWEQFYGRYFKVDSRVLIPRVETNELVKLAIESIKSKYIPGSKVRVLDLCTGSGIIGISLFLELNQEYEIELTMSDVSEEALEVARINCNNLEVKAKLIKSDLFNNLNGRYDVIITNPPYVPTTRKLDPLVLTEPKLALYAGGDGLEIYEQINQQINKLTISPQMLIGEIDESQGEKIKTIFKDAMIIKDMFGNDRFMKVEYDN